MQEGFAYFDAGDRLVYCNDQYRQMHRLGPGFIKPGVRFEDIIRTNIERGNVAEAIGREEEHIRDRMERHRNPKGPIFRRLTDGSSFIINESRTSDGGYCLTMTEVTEIPQIEKDLKENEALTRRMLETSPIGVQVTTRDGTRLYANERSLEILGVTREEFVACDPESFYSDPRIRKKLKAKLYKTGNTPPTEVELVKPDGTPYFVVMSSTVLDFEGQQAHLTYLYDLTDRKKIEQDLVASRELLQALADNLP